MMLKHPLTVFHSIPFVPPHRHTILRAGAGRSTWRRKSTRPRARAWLAWNFVP